MLRVYLPYTFSLARAKK